MQSFGRPGLIVTFFPQYFLGNVVDNSIQRFLQIEWFLKRRSIGFCLIFQ